MPDPSQATGVLAAVNLPLKLVDLLLNWVRRLLGPATIAGFDTFFLTIAPLAAYAAIVAVSVGLLRIGIQADSFRIVLMGLLLIPIGIILLWVGTRMLSAVNRLVGASKCDIASTGFLDVLGLLFLIGGIASTIGGVVGLFSNVSEGIAGIATGALLLYLTGVCLNPVLVAVNVTATATIGQEAIGIVIFLMKSQLRLVNVAFALLLIVAAFVGLQALFTGSRYGGGVGFDPLGLGGAVGGFFGGGAAAAGALVSALTLPLAVYFLSLLAFVFLDVVRSIITTGAHAERELGHRRDP